MLAVPATLTIDDRCNASTLPPDLFVASARVCELLITAVPSCYEAFKQFVKRRCGAINEIAAAPLQQESSDIRLVKLDGCNNINYCFRDWEPTGKTLQVIALCFMSVSRSV